MAQDNDPEPAPPAVQTSVPAIDPISILPEPFNSEMSWTEQGSWHWVTISHEHERRYSSEHFDVSVGQQLGNAWLIATRVRTLLSDDTCTDCYMLSEEEQGPPAILGGTENPLLRDAYENLDNGPRRQIMAEPDSTIPTRWTQGSWYLNYNPTTESFFSWTWIPEDWTTHAEEQNLVPDTSSLPLIPSEIRASHEAASHGDMMIATGASRTMPVVDDYRISQGFGCVQYNSGYPESPLCPGDRPSFHGAIDFAAPPGSTVYAAASGFVTFADIDPSNSSGNSVIRIEHDGLSAGYISEYYHWDERFVSNGDWVDIGQAIATVGSVGYSTGPHLHFGVYDVNEGTWIDPLIWLAAAIQPDPGEEPILQWFSHIEAASLQHNVPAALIAAIISVESGGNPNAISPAGARGLMQVMPFHLENQGISPDRWHEPAANIDAGARILADGLLLTGTMEGAAGRFFGDGCDILGTCTSDYIARVMERMQYFEGYFPR